MNTSMGRSWRCSSTNRADPRAIGADSTQSIRRVSGDNALGAPHIPVKNMMCAFGVPGNMIHGTPGAAFSESPVDAAVAPGMYTT
jgi:hypothetical protein